MCAINRKKLGGRKVIWTRVGEEERGKDRCRDEREREQRKPWIVLLLTPLSFPSRVAGRACRVVLKVTTRKWVISSRAEIRGCLKC